MAPQDIGRRSPDGTKISFSSARLRKPIRSHYSSDLPEMQIYAGFSLKRANAQILKVGWFEQCNTVLLINGRWAHLRRSRCRR